MKSKDTIVLGISVIFWISGCGYSAPYRTSGPSQSDQGVQVGLAGLRCYLSRTGDVIGNSDALPDDPDQVELDLKLQIRNSSDRVAEVSEGRIRLAEPDIPVAKPAAPRRSKLIALLPGETKQVPVNFSPAGVTDCHHGFEIEFSDSVKVGGEPVALSPIDFRAER